MCPAVWSSRIAQSSGIDGVPVEVVADIEVEVAVVVEVGPGRRGRPVAVAAEPGLRGGVLEPAVAVVVIEGVGPPAGDEEVGAAVVVVVAHGDAVAVAAGQRGQAGRGGRRPRTGRRRGCGRGGRRTAEGPARGERSPLDGVDVEPAVAVEVEDGHAAAHGLGELVEVAVPVVEGEDEAAAARPRRRTWGWSAAGEPRSSLARRPSGPSRSASVPPPARRRGSALASRASAAAASARAMDRAGPRAATRPWRRTAGRSPRRRGRARPRAASGRVR